MNNYKSKLYSIHRGMKTRCTNKNYKDYSKYGGSGITVCKEWLSYNGFKIWAEANGYEDGLTLDRKNNELGYTPSNCRWVTHVIQKRNRRKTKANTSGFIGVNFAKAKGKFRAQITLNKRTLSLGSFDTALEGAIVRDNYIIENKLIGFTLNNVSKPIEVE